MPLHSGGGRRSRVRVVVLAAVLVAAVGILTGQGPAVAAIEDGSLGIRLVDAPEDRREDPRAMVYVVDHLSPGTTITRRVEVTNSADREAAVRLYAGPARIVDGAWTPDDRGATSELTSWTSLGRTSAVLAPGASLQVPVTVAVPADASAGERYGVVWAETRSGSDGQVQQISRVGIRVYLSVGPGGEPESDFRIRSLQASRLDDGNVRVAATVENTGGRALDLTGSLRLKDGPGGLSAGPFATPGQTTLGPGDTGVVTVDLAGDLPDGPWRAVMTLRSGVLERTAQATLTFPDHGESAAVDAEPLEAGIPWWWIAAGLVGLAVLLLLLLLVTRRRRPRERRH